MKIPAGQQIIPRQGSMCKKAERKRERQKKNRHYFGPLSVIKKVFRLIHSCNCRIISVEKQVKTGCVPDNVSFRAAIDQSARLWKPNKYENFAAKITFVYHRNDLTN